MKILLSFFLFCSLLFATSVDGKIKKSKRQLSAKKIEYNKMNKELSKVAKKILIAKANQEKLNSKLENLEKKIKNDEEIYTKSINSSMELKKILGTLTNKIDTKQLQFVELISKSFSMALALEEVKTPTRESVMTKEVYKVYSKKNREDLESLKKEIISLESKKKSLISKQLSIKNNIKSYVKERKEYKDKKREQDKIIKELARDKAIYKKRFNRIKLSRKKLERKLANLKIIKLDAQKAAREEALNKKAQREAEANNQAIKRTTVAVNSSEKHENVPTVSSSRIIKYSNKKTISPLKGARLIKKFGTYTDPIYKFKIFNKSITLKAPHSGSKVRSVLNGNIVFSENSGGMLGKVVIIEHSNGIHTIYAKLSRLAPGIKVGKKVTKGMTLGKVDNSLMFEVTKDNKHMDPLNLIRL